MVPFHISPTTKAAGWEKVVWCMCVDMVGVGGLTRGVNKTGKQRVGEIMNALIKKRGGQVRD